MIAKTKHGADASEMKHKIQIIRSGVNAQDPETGEWAATADMVLIEPWASVNDTSGDEYWTAREQQQKTVTIFKIFWCAEIETLTNKDFIVFRGREYDIVHPDNLMYENKLGKIKAVMRS